MKNTNIAISFVNHNASVCVMTDNNVELFIQAERITREKNGQFVNTSNFQTTVESIDTNQPVDNLILIDAPNETIVKEITNFFTSKGISIKTTTITQGHHLFHALSGFYMSGFSEASVLVVDGWGQSFNFEGHIASETTSLYAINVNIEKIKCKPLYKQFFYNHLLTHQTLKSDTIENITYQLTKEVKCPVKISLSPDIGLAYAIITDHLGFGHLQEGKTMGLSNYGQDNPKINEIFATEDEIDGATNPKMFLFERSKILNTKKFKDLDYQNFQGRADIAHATQKSLERDFKLKLDKLLDLSDHKNIVIAGGCALNVINNTLLKDTFPKYNFFVDPIANDASISLGACLFYSQCPFTPQEMQSISWGPKYTAKEILDSIDFFLKDQLTHDTPNPKI